MNRKQGNVKHVAIYLRKYVDEGYYDGVLVMDIDSKILITSD